MQHLRLVQRAQQVILVHLRNRREWKELRDHHDEATENRRYNVVKLQHVAVARACHVRDQPHHRRSDEYSPHHGDKDPSLAGKNEASGDSCFDDVQLLHDVKSSIVEFEGIRERIGIPSKLILVQGAKGADCPHRQKRNECPATDAHELHHVRSSAQQQNAVTLAVRLQLLRSLVAHCVPFHPCSDRHEQHERRTQHSVDQMPLEAPYFVQEAVASGGHVVDQGECHTTFVELRHESIPLGIEH
mmetsp:Transcript_156061/g.500505  ORF Transcript_156061/g.500505 Transcript_156061/m.500505 type:complete len:244 (+) Transcript_156061:609-1340(+)